MAGTYFFSQDVVPDQPVMPVAVPRGDSVSAHEAEVTWVVVVAVMTPVATVSDETYVVEVVEQPAMSTLPGCVPCAAYSQPRPYRRSGGRDFRHLRTDDVVLVRRMATASRMPMIATTIISSISVKPCWSSS